MSPPDDKDGAKDGRDGGNGGDNVISLGTETLFAIADELRRMYDADVRTKPSPKLEQLMRQIERGEDII
jgi:hypothetical protein